MHDEKLARRALGKAFVCHSDHPAYIAAFLIERRVQFDFIRQVFTVPGLAARAIAFRVAALNHKTADDAVEYQAIVKAFFGELDEILCGLWRIRFQQFKLDGSGLGFQHRDAVFASRRGRGCGLTARLIVVLRLWFVASGKQKQTSDKKDKRGGVSIEQVCHSSKTNEAARRDRRASPAAC